MLNAVDTADALFSPDTRRGEGLVWTEAEERFLSLDPDRFYTNGQPDLFQQTVLRETRGQFYSPAKEVYRLFGGLFSPLVRNRGRWPEIMYIHTRSGQVVRPLLARIDAATKQAYRYGSPKRVRGRAVYLGMFMPYFGHFLSEVVSRLWLCDRQELEGVDVYYHATPGSIEAWNTDTSHTRLVESVLAEFGITRDRIHFITEDTVFDDVLCPTPLNRYTLGYHEDYRRIAGRIKAVFRDDSAETPERIFLSRSRFKGRNLINGLEIEDIFRGHGFTIIHPQEHSFGEQIAMAAGADVIAGEEGSAFCNVMFAENPVIIELESGRFHPNLPRLSYMMSRKYAHVLPYTAVSGKLPVGMKTRLYANPQIVERALAEVLGDQEAQSSSDDSDSSLLWERGFFATLCSDVPIWSESLTALISLYPAKFSSEKAAALASNFPEKSEKFRGTIEELLAGLTNLHATAKECGLIS